MGFPPTYYKCTYVRMYVHRTCNGFRLLRGRKRNRRIRKTSPSGRMPLLGRHEKSIILPDNWRDDDRRPPKCQLTTLVVASRTNISTIYCICIGTRGEEGFFIIIVKILKPPFCSFSDFEMDHIVHEFHCVNIEWENDFVCYWFALPLL